MTVKRIAIELGVPVLAIALLTGVLALIRIAVWVPNLSMVYLIGVLAIAITIGSRASIIAAVASFLAFDFFFIDPLYTFTVADLQEWVALGTLLVAGVVTGQLASVARRRAIDARRRERDARVLFDVVRLVGEHGLNDALHAVAERLQTELRSAAVLIRIDETAGGAPAQVGSGDPAPLAAARDPGGGGAARVLGEFGQAEQRTRRWIGMNAGVPERLRRTSGRYELSLVRIHNEGRQLGSLVVVNERGEGQYDEADERLLVAACSLLGRAVERQQLQQEATEAEVLRRTDELRTAMLNAVSHDLRSPLTSIVAAAESLQASDVDWSAAERSNFAHSIEIEGRRVDQMVSHLLDLSRIEAGALRVDPQWRDIGGLLVETVARLRSLAAGHQLSVHVPNDLSLAQFDSVAIGEVLTNLIENAVRHTPVGTEIVVSACAITDGIQIEVSDNGPGLSAEAIGHLFAPFARGTRGRVQTQGSGLGLAVAKGLVEAHGGAIVGENRAEGGARFRFTLPVTNPPPDGREPEQRGPSES